jgi:threonine synthase
MSLTNFSFQRCINPTCAATYEASNTEFRCQKCNNLLDVQYDWDKHNLPSAITEINGKDSAKSPHNSRVWRYSALLPFAEINDLVSISEGSTIFQHAPGLGRLIGLHSGLLHLQYEGFNPSGSFKDNGMAACLTHAKILGAEKAACASTGNTSASLALFASVTGLFQAVVFVGEGKIAFGKLSQALDFGATTLQIVGDFDDAMQQVQDVCQRESIYLVNSINPFRLEGQKTIIYRILESLNWQIPDWIVVPGGNLGNASSFGKSLGELKQLGLIDHCPRLAVINAAGAATLDQLVNQRGITWNDGHVDDDCIEDFYREMDENNRRANTIASAIEINRPVNLKKCLRALAITNGVVTSVTDQQIVDAKALIARHGYGCEPASAASVAGLQKLIENKIIDPDATVVCVLTGHQLKDSDITVTYHQGNDVAFDQTFAKYGVQTHRWQNAPMRCENEIEQIIDVLNSHSYQKATEL